MPETETSAAIAPDRGSRAEGEGQGRARIGVDPARPDESQTNRAAADPSPEDEAIDVASLLGPPNVPAPLHDPPRAAAGEVDWIALHALVVAVESLVSAGLGVQARPIASELRRRIEEARGPLARVLDLRPRRG